MWGKNTGNMTLTNKYSCHQTCHRSQRVSCYFIKGLVSRQHHLKKYPQKCLSFLTQSMWPQSDLPWRTSHWKYRISNAVSAVGGCFFFIGNLNCERLGVHFTLRQHSAHDELCGSETAREADCINLHCEVNNENTSSSAERKENDLVQTSRVVTTFHYSD